MALKSTNTLITDACRTRLKDRERLWAVANKVSVVVVTFMYDCVLQEDGVTLPQDLGQFVQMVMNSENSTSLFTYFGMFILLIFVGGLCFGRISKRQRQLENKLR